MFTTGLNNQFTVSVGAAGGAGNFEAGHGTGYNGGQSSVSSPTGTFSTLTAFGGGGGGTYDENPGNANIASGGGGGGNSFGGVATGSGSTAGTLGSAGGSGQQPSGYP